MQPNHDFALPLCTSFAFAAVLLVLVFALPGCTEDASLFNRGYAEGLEAGKNLGQEEAYRKGLKDGFEKSHPGTPTGLSGFADSLYKSLVWGGALKVLLSLSLATFALLSKGTFAEVVGKVLFTVLGSLLTILIITYLRISKIAEAILISPAPSSLVWQVVWILASAALMYLALDLLYSFVSRTHKAIVQGWIVFLLAGLVTFVAALLLGLAKDVPDVTKYFAANLLSGALVGGIYYLGSGLLTGRFSAVSSEDGSNPSSNSQQKER